MLFNSYEFVFAFLPVALAGIFLLARFVGPGAAQLLLIAASLTFYGVWNIQYLPLLLISIFFNYLIALAMVREPNASRRGAYLAFAAVVNIGLLGYYKYMNFFLHTVGNVTGQHFDTLAIILPLGISFYTFQQLTLLIDISNGSVEKFRLRDFGLFVIFFPHLIAGPIVHHREMMPQFEKATYRFDWSNMAVGSALFAGGLFKKVVLADSIAVPVSALYAQAASGEPMSASLAWGAALGYTLQLYFDFSAYSDMALGLSRMLGIKLPMNFNSPLKATSMIDFWARWHITLTRFLTAYVYTPISVAAIRGRAAKKKKGIAGNRTTVPAFLQIIAVPTLITMFISGLWHGAGDQFIVWGLLHAALLIINHAWRLSRTKFWKDQVSYDRLMRPLGFVMTLTCIAATMIFFRADSVATAFNVVEGMFFLNGAGFAMPELAFEVWQWIIPLLLIAVLAPNLLEIMRNYEPAITMPSESTAGRLNVLGKLADKIRWAPKPVWAAGMAVAAAVSVLALYRVSEFLYWNF